MKDFRQAAAVSPRSVTPRQAWRGVERAGCTVPGGVRRRQPGGCGGNRKSPATFEKPIAWRGLPLYLAGRPKAGPGVKTLSPQEEQEPYLIAPRTEDRRRRGWGDALPAGGGATGFSKERGRDSSEEDEGKPGALCAVCEERRARNGRRTKIDGENKECTKTPIEAKGSVQRK